MRVHFVHRHIQATVVMLEEGNFSLPWCARFDMQVPRKALNGRHLGTVHVTPGTPWVGEVSLLQHHHGVLDVPVHEVHPHFRPCC